jgi:hypothetical protein
MNPPLLQTKYVIYIIGSQDINSFMRGTYKKSPWVTKTSSDVITNKYQWHR